MLTNLARKELERRGTATIRELLAQHPGGGRGALINLEIGHEDHPLLHDVESWLFEQDENAAELESERYIQRLIVGLTVILLLSVAGSLYITYFGRIV